MVSSPEIYSRAISARDPRFDGLFFVGITSTGVYCRPVCPSRMADPKHRRFFESTAAAEGAGYRPCLRCRPELAPGRAVLDAVPRLAQVAARSIAAGALNGRHVADLARELGVSERHLRRALDRELGVSPNALAQTHRLLLAKRLLTDTPLPVTRVAFASGFQSVRRFNAAFQARYRLKPSALRRRIDARRVDSSDGVRLTLAYRAPFAWDALLALLARDALPGAELIQGRRYGRTISIDGVRGVVSATDTGSGHLDLDVSCALVPALMPLLAALRRVFDLDAEPAVVDAHLARAGLGQLVTRHPGLRIPGVAVGFEAVLRALLRGSGRSGPVSTAVARRVVHSLGDPLETGIPGLTRLLPSDARIAEAGARRVAALGVPRSRAATLVAAARASAEGRLRLVPGRDRETARAALLEIDGVHDQLATTILMHALSWPDAFPASDRVLQRAVGAPTTRSLEALAEEWRPWRAYAALHLWLHEEERVHAHPAPGAA